MDFSQHLHDSQRYPSLWWEYRFPNGHDASVIPDPRPEHPFRFEIESTDPDDISSGRIVANLTTGQVEAKLTKVAGLPRNEEAEVSA
jgi:hypothetical protein